MVYSLPRAKVQYIRFTSSLGSEKYLKEESVFQAGLAECCAGMARDLEEQYEMVCTGVGTSLKKPRHTILATPQHTLRGTDPRKI